MAEGDLLQPPGSEEYPTIERLPSFYNPLDKFRLKSADQKHYQQQYGDMYFYRLAKLKPPVEQAGQEAWADLEIGGEEIRRKDRVLDVRQGELCWVVGTVYMDMPLKPNVLEDISKEHGLSVPPPRERYLSPSGEAQIMLEDESGRLRLVGAILSSLMLVTGCIIAVMGTENVNGEFEVVDIKVADLARQPQRWERDNGELAMPGQEGKKKEVLNARKRITGSKIAILSGLGISGEEADGLCLDLLMEYLLGESGGVKEQQGASKISRLIIAGDSLADLSLQAARDEAAGKKVQKKYGYDASAYNPAPTAHLDYFLSTLLQSLPITLLPGGSDPANISLPQQPIHLAMLPQSRIYSAEHGSKEPGWFDSATNPWEGDIDGWRFLGNGGQPLNDIFRYVESEDRLEMMENLLRWRNSAPTAPDTLWCYPFQDEEPFTIEETPHVFFVGNQPSFGTKVIDGPAGQIIRLISIPKFKETGEILLLHTDTLEVEVMRFQVLGDE